MEYLIKNDIYAGDAKDELIRIKYNGYSTLIASYVVSLFDYDMLKKHKHEKYSMEYIYSLIKDSFEETVKYLLDEIGTLDVRDNYIYAYAANMNLNQYQANADWNRIGFKVRVVNGTAGIVNGTYSINMSNIDFTEVNNTTTLTFTLSSLCYYIYLMPSYVDSNGETRGLSSLILSGNINVLSDESLLSIVRAFKDNTEEKTLKVQYSVLRQRFIDSEEVKQYVPQEI
jgi:hypothetical protein